MINYLTLFWLAGIVIAGIILVRVKMPITLTDDFMVGIAAVAWPLVLVCIAVAIISRLFWTEIVDRVLLAARPKPQQPES